MIDTNGAFLFLLSEVCQASGCDLPILNASDDFQRSVTTPYVTAWGCTPPTRTIFPRFLIKTRGLR